jgi:hypothetical protein
MSQLSSSNAIRLLELFRGEMSRMLELKHLLKLIGNPKINEETANFCQMVSLSFPSDL